MEILEGMAAFFERRLEDYDSHMLRDIEGAAEFYEFTASLLPKGPGLLLDLGLSLRSISARAAGPV